MAETYHEEHKMNKHYLRMFTHKSQMGFEKKFFKDFSLYIPIYPPLKPKHTPKEQYLKKKPFNLQNMRMLPHKKNKLKIFKPIVVKKKHHFFFLFQCKNICRYCRPILSPRMMI